MYTPAEGAKTRQAIGEYPDVSLEAARRRCREIIGRVATGEDPAAAARLDRASMTFADLSALYIEKYAKPRKRSWEEDQRIIKTNCLPHIGKAKITTLTRRDFRDIIDRLADDGKLAMSSRTLAVLRKMGNWAVEQDYLETSPAAGLKPRAPNTKRDRVLTDAELTDLLQRVADKAQPLMPEMRAVFRLLAYTGQRSGEVCGMALEELDLEKGHWLIPAARSKNKQAHLVPLPRQALVIVKSFAEGIEAGPLFARTKAAFESTSVAHAVRRIYPDADWTPHDIRRTVATGMASIKVGPHVIEAVLNHISGHKAGVAGVYNRFSYADEKADALQRWADHVDALVVKANG